jgi:hypothetical protein
MGTASRNTDNSTAPEVTATPERYVLAIYDHGGGWRESCWDETSNDDNLKET